jgi:exopolysaccharide production protein ExoZ
MEKKPLRKYHGLEALRFVAAFLVVVYHATSIASERLGGVHVWIKGGYGIDLFFVLSGFVIVWSSSSLFEDEDGWLTFAERRVVRVVPMYWLATTVKATAVILASSMVVHARLTPSTLLASYLFIPCRNLDGNFMPILGVGWTLNYEMFFYALFALALFMKRNVFRFVGVFLTLLAVGSYFRQPSWPWPSFYLNSLVLEFYFGMLIAKSCLAGKRLSWKAALPILVLGTVLLLLPTPLDSLPPVLPEGIPAAMMIWSVASLEDFIPRIPWVAVLSEASYSIYLFHLLAAQLPAVALAKMHLKLPLLAVILSIAISLTLGVVVHRYIERPTTNWLRSKLRVRHQKVVHAV